MPRPCSEHWGVRQDASALLCGAGGGGWSASDMLGFLALSRGDLRGSVDEGLGRRAWGGGGGGGQRRAGGGEIEC